MKILSVDTSATAASVALSEEGKLIGETFINTSLTHSQTLIPMVEQLLNNTKRKYPISMQLQSTQVRVHSQE